jgi:hypothetical protein
MTLGVSTNNSLDNSQMIDTRVIRKRTQDAVSQDMRTGQLAQGLREGGTVVGCSMTTQQMDACVAFIRGYVNATADLLDDTIQAAAAAGVTSELDPIMSQIAAYWSDQYDFIPDAEGLIGLVDDAYLSWKTMELVDDLHRQRSGQRLVPQDLSGQNLTMRWLLGEPLASMIDGRITAIVQGDAIQGAVTDLARSPVPLSYPAVDRSYGGCTLDEYVDIQAGAMGLV